jgi:hypothetical protein
MFNNGLFDYGVRGFGAKTSKRPHNNRKRTKGRNFTYVRVDADTKKLKRLTLKKR